MFFEVVLCLGPAYCISTDYLLRRVVLKLVKTGKTGQGKNLKRNFCFDFGQSK
jgi:hypothetical protein